MGASVNNQKEYITMKSIPTASFLSSLRRLPFFHQEVFVALTRFSANRKMTRAKTVLASSVLLGLALGTAQAETCFRLTPFIDILRLSETNFVDSNVGGTHTLVVGNWIAGRAYTLPVVGSLELDVGSTTVQRLGIHGINKPGGGSGFSDCTLDGIPGGAWDLACSGRNTGLFNNTGTSLTPISCTGLPASVAASVAAEEGKAALQP
jgi:hypothetical protein